MDGDDDLYDGNIIDDGILGEEETEEDIEEESY